MCSALEKKGIEAAWNLISECISQAREKEHFTKKRQEQNRFWLLQSIENQLKDQFFQDEIISEELKIQLQLIAKNKRSPFAAAEHLLNLQKKRL